MILQSTVWSELQRMIHSHNKLVGFEIVCKEVGHLIPGKEMNPVNKIAQKLSARLSLSYSSY